MGRGGIWEHLEGFLVATLEQVQLMSGERRPGTLLNVLPCQDSLRVKEHTESLVLRLL